MAASGKTDARSSFRLIAPRHGGGLAVVISDFFDGHGFEGALDILRHFRHDICGFTLPATKRSIPGCRGEPLLVDAETTHEWEIRSRRHR
jgi:hypothetical protein